MIILRNKFFSKKKDKENKDDNSGVKSAAIIGGAIAGNETAKILEKKAGKYLAESRNNSEEAEKIRKAILKEAKKNGVKVKAADGLGDSMYTGRAKWQRKLSEGIEKLYKRTGQINDLNDLGSTGKMIKNLGKDTVLLDTSVGALRDVDVLAHELGHAHHSSKRSKSIVGKAAHKLITPAKLVGSASRTAGFISGLRSAKKKAEGKEEGVVNKNIAWALPTVSGGTVLIDEGAASHKALKDLKRLGASKAVRGLAKKRLGAALGTYGAHVAGQVATSLGLREAGKLVGKAVYRKKNKKEKED